MRKLSLLLIFTILTKACFCWWDLGHMLVAKVAELTLLQEDPDAFDLGNRIASILNIFSHGKVNNFVESACWPDDLKSFSLHAMDDWHFIDIPVNMTKIFDYINVTSTPDDALGILVRNHFNFYFEMKILTLRGLSYNYHQCLFYEIF